MKKLYDEKLINSDFAVMDSAKWVDPVVNNKAGVIVDVVDVGARIDDKIHAALAKEGKDEPEKHYIDVTGGVTGTDGQPVLYRPPGIPAFWRSRNRRLKPKRN